MITVAESHHFIDRFGCGILCGISDDRIERQIAALVPGTEYYQGTRKTEAIGHAPVHLLIDLFFHELESIKT